MPEGDTVYRQCRMLHGALAGAVLTAAELRVPRLATADLVDWQVDEVVPCGKHLLIRLCPPDAGGDDRGAQPLTLHNHLNMDGIWLLEGKRSVSGDAPRGPRIGHTARVVLSARHPDGREVRAIGDDVKQVRLVPTADEHELVGHLGPDLLDPEWGDDHRKRAMENVLAAPSRPVGLALLDQRVMAGIGNIYRSELCFLQRIQPRAPVSQLTDPGAMVDLARHLLMVNKDRAVRVTTGGMLGRGGDLWVYGRGRRPCRRCGTRIVREELADPSQEGTEPRVIYTCPRCQG